MGKGCPRSSERETCRTTFDRSHVSVQCRHRSRRTPWSRISAHAIYFRYQRRNAAHPIPSGLEPSRLGARPANPAAIAACERFKMIQLKRKQRAPSSVLGLSLDGSRLEGVVLLRTNGSVVEQKSFFASLSLDPLTNDPELVGREI